jgi:Zn-dependent protease/CBS domain-containing protein
MAWSIPFGRLFGIPIRVHLTFLLLMLWLVLRGSGRNDLAMMLQAVGLFVCVLAHELGHAVVARRVGIDVRHITLLPIGGVARLDRTPRVPRHELWIAAAGPAVSLVLAGALYAAARVLESPLPVIRIWDAPGHALGKLALLNALLAGLNLLPAFPMDGGRILRAFLAGQASYPQATRVAVALGQLFAFLLGFVGLLWQPWLVFVALLVFLGAAEESVRVQTQSAVEGVPVRDATMTQFSTLRRADSLGRAVELLLAGAQQDFPVVEAGEVVGILTRGRLIEALARGGRDLYVSEAMAPAPPPVDADAPLAEVLEQMARDGVTVVPVQSSGELCGIVTTENAAEFILVRGATAASQRPRDA